MFKLCSRFDLVAAMREGAVKTKSDIQIIAESTAEERLAQTVQTVVSLKDVSLEVRRKEASKPLYLRRYE